MLRRLQFTFLSLLSHGFSNLWQQPITSLDLRLSLRRLLRGSAHPILIFLGLLQPFPWYMQVPRDQLTPLELKHHPTAVLQRQDGIFQLRCIPLFRLRDTPLRSIYRLYEYMCAGFYTQVQYETEYFYFHDDSERWSLETIPDPKDKDQQRYAFVASIVEALVVAFNWRLCLGLQRDRSRVSFAEMDLYPPRRIRSPEWAVAVPPLPELLIIADNVDRRKTPFEARNIVGVNNGHMYSI